MNANRQFLCFFLLYFCFFLFRFTFNGSIRFHIFFSFHFSLYCHWPFRYWFYIFRFFCVFSCLTYSHSISFSLLDINGGTWRFINNLSLSTRLVCRLTPHIHTRTHTTTRIQNSKRNRIFCCFPIFFVVVRAKTNHERFWCNNRKVLILSKTLTETFSFVSCDMVVIPHAFSFDVPALIALIFLQNAIR